MNHNWDPPQLSWFKCNIGASWSSNSSIEGASWVLRDADGNVSILSRRAFFYSFSLHELKFNALFWTMESMTHHRINRVTFDTEVMMWLDELIESLLILMMWLDQL